MGKTPGVVYPGGGPGGKSGRHVCLGRGPKGNPGANATPMGAKKPQKAGFGPPFGACGPPSRDASRDWPRPLTVSERRFRAFPRSGERSRTQA